jgi:alkylation response protein AidB-like acyl-CoA dehydrogenase
VREAASDDAEAARWLGPVAAGECAGTLAVAEGKGWSCEDVHSTATPEGDSYVLAGTKRWVLLEGAEEIACAVRLPGTTGEDGLTLVVVSATDVSIEPVRSIDATRVIGHVTLDGVRIASDRVLGEPGRVAGALRRAIEEATVAASLELVGTLQAIFDTNLRYAKERHQFGVPIGSFQALQHRAVDLHIHKEVAEAVLAESLAALDRRPGAQARAAAASRVKARCADAALKVTRETIQLHGAIGFTDEFDAGLYLKRAMTLAAWLGGPTWHRRRYARLTAEGQP